MVVKLQSLTTRHIIDQKLQGAKTKDIKPTTEILFDNDVRYCAAKEIDVIRSAAGGAIIQFKDEDEFGNSSLLHIEITKDDIDALQQIIK